MISSILKVPDLKRSIFYTLMAMVVFRIGAHITIPGINPQGLNDLTENLSQSALGGLISYFDLFVGGAFEQFTIFALGLMPYITASIVLQLFTAVIPHLDKLRKEGEAGRRKMQNYTRYGTILICVVQSAAISRWIASHEGILSADLNGNVVLFVVIAVVSITTGTMFLMWLGDKITERGVGNGISLIIFAGIAARIPMEFIKTLNSVQTGTFNPVGFMAILIVFAVIIFFVVYEQQGQRRIPIQFARKVVGRKVYGAQNTYLPFKINPTGVIPIIFASAMVMVPSQIAQMFGDKYPTVAGVAVYFSPGHIPYMFVYGFLVILFAYMYTTVQFNPIEIASDLKKTWRIYTRSTTWHQYARLLAKSLDENYLSGLYFSSNHSCLSRHFIES